MPRLAPDVWLGIFIAAAAIFAALVVVPLAVEAVPGGARSWLQAPRFLPLVCLYTIGLLGVVIAIRSVRTPVAKSRSGGIGLRAVALVGAAIALLSAGAQVLGTMAASVIICTALMVIGGERRFWVLAIAGVLVPIAAVLLLVRLAAVPLPQGLLSW